MATRALPQQLPPSPGLARLRRADGAEAARTRVVALQRQALADASNAHTAALHVPFELPFGNGTVALGGSTSKAAHQNLVYALCRTGTFERVAPFIMDAWRRGREGMEHTYHKSSIEYAAWTAGRDERRLVERR